MDIAVSELDAQLDEADDPLKEKNPDKELSGVLNVTRVDPLSVNTRKSCSTGLVKLFNPLIFTFAILCCYPR